MTEHTASSSVGSEIWAQWSPEELLAYFPGDDQSSRVNIQANIVIVYGEPGEFMTFYP